MAETLLSFGVQKLWDLLVRESERFQGVGEQFTELRRELFTLQGFLKDAEAKKHTNETLRNTLKQIKEIVYDAEDIIHTFLQKKELGKTNGIKKHITQLACFISDHRKLSFDIESLTNRISTVMRDMEGFGIQQVIVNDGYTQLVQERQREMRQTFSSHNESVLVGLEKKVKKLVDYLVEKDSSQVVSITGMGGIGKTTLARQVSNHETVKSHFAGGVAWVYVSQNFTRRHVWQTILRKLSPEYRELKMSEDEIQGELFRVLQTSKALIVLDDVWRDEDWDKIKPMFPREKGWKVLLTSRNEGVALHADPTCFTFRPSYLTPEQSWTLFQSIAFPEENTTQYKVDDKEMDEMGKQMIKHCGGLPLAIKVLGGLLAAQYALSEWERVYKNYRNQIVGGISFNGKNISSVYHVLSLSYEELPIYLKKCFLYLAHFPEDCVVNVGTLAYYWAAEGIPKPRYYDEATIEEVADIYIEELVKRNMVIATRNDRTSRFETCRLHDQMREVCLHKAEEENFLQSVDARNRNSAVDYQARRLIILWPDHSLRIENQKIRSLIFILEYVTECWTASCLKFKSLQLLRVLDLSGASFERGILPSDIGKLIHLRYLSLYGAGVTHLPDSLRNLRLLLYLNLCVFDGSPIYVPNVVKKMQELLYLSLPRNMDDKTKLKLRNVQKLETLQNFSTAHSDVTDLQDMQRLETLSIMFNDECTSETMSSTLSLLTRLKSLRLSGKTNEEEFVLVCNNVNSLEVSIWMPRITTVNHFPINLTTITLSDSRFKEDPMPILENLLHLRRVSFQKQAFVGKIMTCSSGGFPQLEELGFSQQYEWEEWVVEKGSMPNLRSLSILHCEKLKELPDGLQFIHSFKDLTMGKKWEESLSKGGKDNIKVQHIPSVTFLRH